MSKVKGKVEVKKIEEVPESLPAFPITWTSIGVRIETNQENLDLQNLTDYVNKITLPQINIAVIESQEQIDKEIRSNSDLGSRLKSSKQESGGDKRKKDDPWLPPSGLLLECFDARSTADRDQEHKKEDMRRKKSIESAQLSLQNANKDLEAARNDLSTLENSIKATKEESVKVLEALKQAAQDSSFGKDKPKEEVEKPKDVNPKRKASIKLDKDQKGLPLGKSKGKDKVSKDEPVESPDEVLQKLMSQLPGVQMKCEEMEKKVAIATSFLDTLKASELDPYTLVQVYCVVGIGNDPTYISSLGNGLRFNIQAILNLQLQPKIGQDMNNNNNGSLQGNQTVSELLKGIKSIANSAGLDEPIRQIALLDVTYEDNSSEISKEQEIKEPIVDDKKSGKKKVKDAPKVSLPYENMAKSLALSLRKLVSVNVAYRRMKDAVQHIKIPSSIPFKDVDTRFYNKMISQVPRKLVSVPVLLHCVVEQAVLNSVCANNPEEKYWAEEKKKVEGYLTNSFVKLGQNSKGFNGMDTKICNNWKASGPTCVNDKGKLHYLVCERAPSQTKRDEDVIPFEKIKIIHENDSAGRISANSNSIPPGKDALIDVQHVTTHLSNIAFIPGKGRRGMPIVPILSKEERSILESIIESQGPYSASMVHIYRKLKIIMEFSQKHLRHNPQENQLLEESIRSIRQDQFIELFPESVTSEVYSKARITRPLQKLIYDEIEDCILCVLYAVDGQQQWNYSLPCQIPFSDFSGKHQDLKSFKMDPMSYGIEEQKSQIHEKEEYYLLGGDSLLSLSLKYPKANGTLYMDGGAYVLRLRKDGNVEMSAHLEDGLDICFFKGKTGQINVQLSTPDGTTIEMDPLGLTYIFNTELILTKEQKEETQEVKLTEMKHRETWRCILPTGSLISCKQNGELVILFRNGNVSEQLSLEPGTQKWITTNSKGYQVLEGTQQSTPQTTQGVAIEEVTNIAPSKVDSKAKTQKDAKESKDSKDSKATKKEAPQKNKGKGEIKEETPPPPPNDSNNPPDKITKLFGSNLTQVKCEDPSKPSLLLLPKRRLVKVADLQTGCSIESREDLVTIVRSRKDELIVCHSDGTEIYTTPATFKCPSSSIHNLMKGLVNDSNLPMISPIGSVTNDNNNMVGDVPTNGDKLVPITWQVKKEGYPIVYSEGDNILVDLSVDKKPYKLKLCKSTGEIRLCLPNGKRLYTKGTSVILDASSTTRIMPSNSSPGEDVKDLDRWEKMHVDMKKDHPGSQVHGQYAFDLEKGEISNDYVNEKMKQIRLAAEDLKSSLKKKKRTPKIDSLDRVKYENQGPSTRFFVFYQNGQGYEISGKQAFRRLLDETQSDEHLMYSCEEFKDTQDKLVLHTFVRRFAEKLKRRMSINNGNGCDEVPIKYKLPPVLNQNTISSTKNDQSESWVSFRHIKEYPRLNEQQREEMLNHLKNLGTVTQDILKSRKAKPGKIKVNKPVEEVTQVFAQTPYPNVVKLTNEQQISNVIDDIKREIARRVEKVENEGGEHRFDKYEGFYKFLSKKKHSFPCKHISKEIQKASKSMKTDGLLYFKCEEGMDSVFWDKHKQKLNHEASDIEIEALKEIVDHVFQQTSSSFWKKTQSSNSSRSN